MPIAHEPQSPMATMPNPTPVDLVDPVFEALWRVVRTWDVNVPGYYQGYCGANGSHVMLLLQALRDAGIVDKQTCLCMPMRLVRHSVNALEYKAHDEAGHSQGDGLVSADDTLEFKAAQEIRALAERLGKRL